MDPKLEKDLTLLTLKTDGLTRRGELMLALADLLNEYHQLVLSQRKVITVLTAKLTTYESANPVSESVRETPSTAPVGDSGASGRLDLSGLKEVRSADVVRNSSQVSGG